MQYDPEIKGLIMRLFVICIHGVINRPCLYLYLSLGN